MLQVRKVIEHVYEKVIVQGSDGSGGYATTTTGTMSNGGQMVKTENDKDDEMSSLADEKVELLCNDQVRNN